MITRWPALARNEARKDVAPLGFKAARWPSRDQWLREANEFSRQLRAKPPGLANFGLLSFIVIVLLPTLAAIIYFAALASDQYLAEARFAVRSLRDISLASDIGAPKIVSSASNRFVQGNNDDLSGGSPAEGNVGGSTSALSMLAGSTDQRLVGLDAYVLSNFIESRNMVAELNKDIALRTIYSRPDADWLARLDPSVTEELLWRYWRGKVTPSIDTISGIVTLRVLAFRPDDAVAIANDVIHISRQVVDDYSRKISGRLRSRMLERVLRKPQIVMKMH